MSIPEKRFPTLKTLLSYYLAGNFKITKIEKIPVLFRLLYIVSCKCNPLLAWHYLWTALSRLRNHEAKSYGRIGVGNSHSMSYGPCNVHCKILYYVSSFAKIANMLGQQSKEIFTIPVKFEYFQIVDFVLCYYVFNEILLFRYHKCAFS